MASFVVYLIVLEIIVQGMNCFKFNNKLFGYRHMQPLGKAKYIITNLI